jgi:hypothetical protein
MGNMTETNTVAAEGAITSSSMAVVLREPKAIAALVLRC